jgi:small subunit ribosomal protein S21
MATVRLTPGMPIQVALSKFKKAVETEGILKDLRKKEFYIKPSVAKKLKSINARKAAKKKIRVFKDKD